MRAFLPAYDLRAPATLREALSLLAGAPNAWRPFAGGTDLMVLLEAGKLPEARYLGLWKLSELRGIEERGDTISLGALTTYTEVMRSAVLQTEFPLLCRAAAETGGVATQNKGTLGGNIANASPAADTPPALLVYRAELELVSQRGTRRVVYDQFHRGYKEMDLAPDELIARIHLPRRPAPWRQVLPEGRYPARPGDLQGLSRRRRRARRRQRRHSRGPDRRQQRGADRHAVSERGARASRPRARSNRVARRTGSARL